MPAARHRLAASRMSVYTMPRALDPFSDVDIQEFLRLRRNCEVKGSKCQGRASQRHHALFRRDKRFPQLNVAMNYQATCEHCHTGTGEADATDNKYRFYEIQCNRYGAERVDGWIESLPLKNKTF